METPGLIFFRSRLKISIGIENFEPGLKFSIGIECFRSQGPLGEGQTETLIFCFFLTLSFLGCSIVTNEDPKIDQGFSFPAER